VISEAHMRKDTYFEDNVLFEPNADIPVKQRRPKKSQCVDSANFDIGQMSGQKKSKR
jgi:hypothetical protein